MYQIGVALFPRGEVPECDADICPPGMFRHTSAGFPFFRMIKDFYCAQLDCVISQKRGSMEGGLGEGSFTREPER